MPTKLMGNEESLVREHRDALKAYSQLLTRDAECMTTEAMAIVRRLLDAKNALIDAGRERGEFCQASVEDDRRGGSYQGRPVPMRPRFGQN